MAVMLLAPMVQNVSETDRTPHMNAFLISISFPRFQSIRTRNFSEASITMKPANIRGSTFCIPDPVGLNPRSLSLALDNVGPEQRSRQLAPKRDLGGLTDEPVAEIVQCGEPFPRFARSRLPQAVHREAPRLASLGGSGSESSLRSQPIKRH